MVEWLKVLRGEELSLVGPNPEDPRQARTLEAGYGVEFHGFRLSNAASLAGAAGALAAGRPIQEGLFHVAAAQRALRSVLAAERPDVVVVQMVRCWWAMELLSRGSAAPPVVFDAIDAMGLHFERAARSFPRPLGFVVRREAQRCRRVERRMAEISAVTTAVARRDLEAIRVPPGRGRLVPVGAPGGAPRSEPPKAPTVLLSGNLGYRPTRRGALWFAEEVWPEVRRRIPEARWVLAGARPPRSLRRLAGLPGVEVVADVPDLAPYFAAARVAIAPMADGSGVPMKVLEAWANGVPVVAHPWSAAGLEAVPGTDLLVAESAAAWRDAVARLLVDQELASRIAAAGRARWETVYSRDRVAEAIRQVVGEAAGRRMS